MTVPIVIGMAALDRIAERLILIFIKKNT